MHTLAYHSPDCTLLSVLAAPDGAADWWLLPLQYAGNSQAPSSRASVTLQVAITALSNVPN